MIDPRTIVHLDDLHVDDVHLDDLDVDDAEGCEDSDQGLFTYNDIKVRGLGIRVRIG